jgi:hypothetical protein
VKPPASRSSARRFAANFPGRRAALRRIRVEEARKKKALTEMEKP